MINPYKPAGTRPVFTVAGPPTLNWLAITMAFVIFLLVGCIIVGGVLVYFSVKVIEAIFQHSTSTMPNYSDPWIILIAKALGFVPSLMGALYLGLHVKSRPIDNAIMYSVWVMAFSCFQALFRAVLDFNIYRDSLVVLESLFQVFILVAIVSGIARLRNIPMSHTGPSLELAEEPQEPKESQDARKSQMAEEA